MHTYRLDLAWDGTAYCGWQRQPSCLSIQEVVESALQKIFPTENIGVLAAGRTDAGVHALQQICAFSIQHPRCPEVIQRGINAKLPKDIVCIAVQEVASNFHPRHHSKEKIYRYRIWHEGTRSPFEHPFTWHFSGPLDVNLMAECAQVFIGTHDFSAFRAAGCSATYTVRTIQSSSVTINGPEIHFTVCGKGFLRHMVRIMMGTLVAVGQHKLTLENVRTALQGGGRVSVGMTAPAKGLCLVSTTLLDIPIESR